MKIVFAGVAVATAAISFSVGTATGTRTPAPKPVTTAKLNPPVVYAALSPKAANDVIENYCVDCHDDQLRSGNDVADDGKQGLSLEHFDVAAATSRPTDAERIIRKLRSGIMPQTPSPRPLGDTLEMFAASIEQVIDKAAKPNPGTRTFQRLNRAEYDNVIRDLFGITIDASAYLPLDTKSANFDNIADVQALSPALLDAYLNAASAVSRMAVGDKTATAGGTTYPVSPFASQHPWDYVQGAPLGTYGGIVTKHNFIADGTYQFRMEVMGGIGMPLADVDVSIDGKRVALLHYEKGTTPTGSSADAPEGIDRYETDTLTLKGGEHMLSVAMVKPIEGPYEDLLKPDEWSNSSDGNAATGNTNPPSIKNVMILGPYKVTGLSDTPARRAIFSCHPTKGAAAERACATQILTRLGTKAYRRPLTKHDVDGLMGFYDSAVKTGDFEDGVRNAIQAMLSSPYFVFRIESAPANVTAGTDYKVADTDLASRLSFFLWGSMPDSTLMSLAKAHKLSDQKVLDAQAKRMLADPRAQALSERFAAQFFDLQDVDKVHPDAFFFPDFNKNLSDDMQTETKLFFNNIVKNDLDVLQLLDANYTFVNERLARHYGIPNVAGPDFRKVMYPDSTRRGILGQGSMLVQTSFADRTSPTVRGKWVMKVLLGTPPPPPPPNVPSLDVTANGVSGRPLTTRERVEQHRKNPVCASCHMYMDPIGLALDNFDNTGKWRYSENSAPLDTRSKLFDGAAIDGESGLVDALMRRKVAVLRNFAENLMAYGLGRRVEDFDQPTVRSIVASAQANGDKFSQYVLGVVNSTAFREKRAEPVVADDKQSDNQKH
ncbi:MAG TPA: DUF1592 domain-containing protein [Gemmatimonadaceae bacterium]|jgi:hypothetical protein